MKRSNHYAEFGLQRVAERRADAAWIKVQFEAEDTVVFPVWRSQNLIFHESDAGDEPRAVTIPWRDASALLEAGAEQMFLGLREGVAHFAVDLSVLDDPHDQPALDGIGEFVELRSVGIFLSREVGGMLAYAKGLSHWHSRHLFCGVCGGATEMRETGHLRVCTNTDCGAQHFPRTDPAVIMLVSKGDRAVLGRKRIWPDGMYSTLAGFVEPGESLEEAVAREVMEEVGIPISNVRYHSSQPSLMLGFYADAEGEEINMNVDELEDARWFTRAELAGGAAGIDRRPRSDSIARHLIEEWVKEG